MSLEHSKTCGTCSAGVTYSVVNRVWQNAWYWRRYLLLNPHKVEILEILTLICGGTLPPTDGALSYSVSHEKYKHRENQKLEFFRFFRNFRLILHGNEKNSISPNFVQKTGFLYFDASELFEKSSKIKIFFF